MLVELSKQDLINLVKGTEPTHEQMSDPLVAKYGHYIGGFSDRWIWNTSVINKCTEEEIYKLYLLVK